MEFTSACSVRRGPLDEGADRKSVPVRNYDVFLNHRGPDVKKTFVSHLSNALKKVLFISFVDNREIQPGDLSWPTIKSAIHHSKFHIAVFSPRYAESEWCLEELRHLMECFKERSADFFLPVFYNVTPGDLRLRTLSCYNSAFEKHGSKYTATIIDNWKKDLHAASMVSGFIFPNAFQGDEGRLVERVVSKVIQVLSKATLLPGPSHPVGVDEKLQEALNLMERERCVQNHGMYGMGGLAKASYNTVYGQLDDSACFMHSVSEGSKELQEALNPMERDKLGRWVQKLGIYGMGGVGKTTLAKAIYNRIHRQFDSPCFMHSVSEGSKDASMGLKGLQTDMLQELLGTKEISVRNPEHGKQMMRDRLEGKKVLIILDDVSEETQLDKLMPCHLGEGSQIVITTRDEEVLNQAQVQTRLQMEQLRSPLAHDLFKLHAFDLPEEPSGVLNNLQEEPSGDLKDLAEKMADTCQGLPLALEVLGSYVRGKHISKWEATAKVLETGIVLLAPQRKVTQILKMSFDALGSKEEKEMFLDIACFLFQEPRDKGIRIWESEYHGAGLAELCLDSLIHKCLVKVDKNGLLTMHDLLRDMGREIVDNSHKDYWERSHLWRVDDVHRVLRKRKGTSHVRGLSSNDEKVWETTSFAGMDELKLLVLSNVTLTGNFSKIPEELRWFQLRNCPLRTPLPLDEMGLEKLAVLDLEGSNLTSFNCAHYTLQNLKELNLGNCSNFKEFPVDFCKSFNSLEILTLSGCVNLERMPDSVSELSSSLRYLDISGCSKLSTLPNDITDLRALTTLLMNNCGRLTSLPNAIGQLTALEKIGLDRVPLSTLPLSFGSLSNLVSLRLDHSSKLRELPSTIGDLRKLTSLDIISCPLISEIPPEVTKLENLVHLEVSDCESVTQLPENMGAHRNLEILNLQSCPNLCRIPGLPFRLKSLDVGGCSSLKDLELMVCCNLKTLPNGIETLTSLQTLSLIGLYLGTLPQSFISDLSNLEQLSLYSFSDLQEIQCLPSTLTSLVMSDCSTLGRLSVSCLSSLTSLCLLGCNRLVELNGLECLGLLSRLDIRKCKGLVELNGLECLGLLSRLDIRECRSLVDLPSGQLEKLTSLKELYLAGSGVGIVQDNRSPWIQKMDCLEVVNMTGDEFGICFQGVHLDTQDKWCMKMVVPEGDIACRGALMWCLVWTEVIIEVKGQAGEGRKFYEKFENEDWEGVVFVRIYRALHPFVASLKGGDEIRVYSFPRGCRTPAAVVKLMYGENEMEETLQKLSLINARGRGKKLHERWSFLVKKYGYKSCH